MIRQLQRKFSRAYRRGGVVEVAWLCLYNVGCALRALAHRGARATVETDEFDSRMGTETAAHVELSKLEIASPNYIYGVKYQPTLPRQFQSIVDQLSIRREDFTFVDFGSGKGLALLLAAEAGFGRVVGIEFSPQLNAIAESNVLAFQRSTPRADRIRCICGDAVSFAILDTPLICYFFNPFQEPVMRTVLGSCCAA